MIGIGITYEHIHSGSLRVSSLAGSVAHAAEADHEMLHIRYPRQRFQYFGRIGRINRRSSYRSSTLGWSACDARNGDRFVKLIDKLIAVICSWAATFNPGVAA